MDKRYHSYADYFRSKYGERLQKLVIDAGFTCPNRDGTVGSGGCSYCDNAAFHPGYSTPGKSIAQQLDEGISFHQVRYRGATHYLAYFQSFSNTYGTVERLRQVYCEALEHPRVVGLVIGTRPDCIDDARLDLLEELRDKPMACKEEPFRTPTIQIEYGIESCYDETLAHIGRGHDFDCARRAVEATAARGFDVGAHFILGLPGETRQMLLDQCARINALPLHSVKFHQLQLVKGTRMEAEAREHPERFLDWTLDEYLDLVIDILERLRPDLYIERVAGEVPPRFVEKTRWGLIRNFQILHLLDERLDARGTRQGALWSPAIFD